MKGSKLNLRNSRISDVKVQPTLGLWLSAAGLESASWAFCADRLGRAVAGLIFFIFIYSGKTINF
jgi:hypothetical protein